MSTSTCENEVQIQQPEQSCRYCHGLQYFQNRIETDFDEWVLGITSSLCRCCRLLVQAVRQLAPQFFDAVGKRPDTQVVLTVSERCRIGIMGSVNGRGSREVDIQLYSTNDASQEIPFIEKCGDISPVSGDESMWLFLRKCVKDCMNDHDECKAQQDPDWYPARLLQLTSGEGNETLLRLVETKDHRPNSRYIALSHCWGHGHHLRATSKNLDRLRREIGWEELPRTFQDCVTVARELDIQFVWIDSLCIIHDIRSDWAGHAGSMDHIYENALFTVGAVSSEDSSVPFLGPEARSDRHSWQAINLDTSEFTGFPSQIKARHYSPLLLSTFVLGPLEKRAWAWQERYLSKRMIDFTQEEVRWQCLSGHSCECTGSMVTRKPGRIGQRLLKTGENWRDTVSGYSERRLTYATDRLPALSGAASRFQADIQSKYLAGLWLADFPDCLAWYRREGSDSSNGKPKMWRSLDNAVPSWSWASVANQSLWIRRLQKESDSASPDSCVELIGVDCEPSTENIFGEVLPGSYIELRGKVVEAEMESDVYGCGRVDRKHFGPQFVTPDCHIIDGAAIGTGGEPEGFRASVKSRLRFSRDKTTTAMLRRALPSDRIHNGYERGTRSKGLVSCLLLFTTESQGKSNPCVLILSEQPGNQDDAPPYYQRLGIGCGDSADGGPLYEGRKGWDVWKEWEDLERWECWEDWFADAQIRTLRVV